MKLSLKIIILFCLILHLSKFPDSAASAKKTVIITGSNVKSRLADKKQGDKIRITELTGNPVIRYDGSELKSNKIIVRGEKEEIAEAVGNVVLTDKKNTSRIKSGKALFYKETNTIEFSEKPSAIMRREDDRSTVNIRAKKIKYYIDEKHAEASGNVIVKNNDISIFSQKASFSRNEKTIIFSENPKIIKGEENYAAETVFYYTDKKLIVLDNNARIKTFSEEKDEKTGKIKKIQLNAYADKIEHYDINDKLTIMYGNAQIERKDAVFKGDKFELQGSEGNEELSGHNVHIDYRSENAEAFGNSFKSHNKTGYFALWGNSYIVFKNNKTNEETSRTTGDFMEYYKDTDELYVSGNVKIFRSDGVIRGDFARYQRQNDLMIITGNARMEKENSVLITQSITINTKSNNTRLHGNIRGRGVN
ncbi:MAG: LPS export ABC transporter periplasmic protein LptC [Spirochaetes bacterium]|nr:LPS export ABC transporter periplasmic protein LptC [Spirochaetota bacterium]